MSFYTLKGLTAEIEKYKEDGCNRNEDFEPEERSEIMRTLAKNIEANEKNYRNTETRFVYNRGIQEIKIKSKEEISGEPVFSGLIKYFEPYQGFDIIPNNPARVKAIIHLFPAKYDEEVDELAKIIRESGFCGSIEKKIIERDVFGFE